MARPSLATQRSPASEPMWPLDLGIGIVGTLVGYTVLSQFQFDDSRWLHNAWTYVGVVAGGVIFLALLSRRIASRFVAKSAQLGFLASLLVHLLLMLLAVNVIVFGRYFPEAFTAARSRQVTPPNTVPEYLFSAPAPSPTASPDWSQPVDAETASPVMPLEQRQLPPVEKTASRLEMPHHEVALPREPERFLVPRPTAAEALPMPADAPGLRSKRPPRVTPPDLPEPVSVSIAAPQVPLREPPVPVPAQRQAAARRAAAAAASLSAPASVPTLPQTSRATESSSLAARATPASEDQLPTVGNFGANAQRTTAQQRQPVLEAAGAAPAPLAVPIANETMAEDRLVLPVESPLTRGEVSLGASLRLNPEPIPAELPRPGVAAAEARAALAETTAGMPSITAGAARAATSRRTAGPLGSPQVGPAGDAIGLAGPDPSGAAGQLALADAAAGGEAPDAVPVDVPADRLADTNSTAQRTTSPGHSHPPATGADTLPLDFDLPLALGGLADLPAERVGLAPALDPPPITALSLRDSPRRRLEVGGPIQPLGSEVAAVEMFRRRMQRTDGSGAPTPNGAVGPETEEAIERGLRFLASRQQPAGHWTLQSPDEPVPLQSDTAATGLCLLSFQGAGYTHRQHQYAAVVSGGLRALLAMQRPDGNLYRPENPASDQNVMFYSHGIAALALCEAYGMTGDETLRAPAQAAIDFIVNTQHPQRGGWRYQPGVSSDTSVSGWMMMALKSGELAGLRVPESTYAGIDRWLEFAKASPSQGHLYRYNPFAPDTPAQRHGRDPTPSMTAVAMLMRMYSGWSREQVEMQRAADYLAAAPPAIGDARRPQRDTYYWYYATLVMFHMGGGHWDQWHQQLKPLLVDNQIKSGPLEGSWDPKLPVPDRWSYHAGRLYLTTLNLLSLEVHYRHLPIYENTAK